MLAEDSLLRDWIFYVGALCFFIMVLTWVLGYFLFLRPFDKVFQGRNYLFEQGIPLFSYVMRMSRYMFSIAFPSHSKKDKGAQMVYEYYDFRGNATKLQIIVSYIYMLCVLLAIVLAAVLYTHDVILGLGPEGR